MKNNLLKRIKYKGKQLIYKGLLVGVPVFVERKQIYVKLEKPFKK